MDTFDYVNETLTAAQVAVLATILGDEWSEKARDGFLVVAGRFLDNFGFDRTEELAEAFATNLPEGRKALRRSLEALLDYVGGLRKFGRDYFVLINDENFGSLPLYPQLPILGISSFKDTLYRVINSTASLGEGGELVSTYIMREHRLPFIAPFRSWVLRRKPRFHWCSYDSYASPEKTRSALQIIKDWNSDCKLRATLKTDDLEGSAFIAFNADWNQTRERNPSGWENEFIGYFVEPKAQDHREFEGGGIQIAVTGARLPLKFSNYGTTNSRSGQSCGPRHNHQLLWCCGRR